MTNLVFSAVFAFSAVVIGHAAVAAAQAVPDAMVPRLAAAREAQLAGRTGDVIRLTEEIVRVAPGNREAASLRIDALVADRQVRRAAAEYDRYASSIGSQDPQLLAILARAELWALSGASGGMQLRMMALERLARGGDQAALQSLRATAANPRATVAERVNADQALARLGEADAVQRLIQFGDLEAIHDRTPIVEALEAANARAAVPWIRQRLDDQNPLTRAAAARALGALKASETIARLRELLNDRVFLVRLSAAVSLKRLGDPAADTLLAGWLQSELGDVRLMAAEAYSEGVTREWVKAVSPYLRASSNDLERIKAADLLRRQDAATSRTIVFDAVRSANPAVRDAASRLLESMTPDDLGLLRSLLDDESPWVRLHASGALLKL